MLGLVIFISILVIGYIALIVIGKRVEKKWANVEEVPSVYESFDYASKVDSKEYNEAMEQIHNSRKEVEKRLYNGDRN